jgi:hypothetical protein
VGDIHQEFYGYLAGCLSPRTHSCPQIYTHTHTQTHTQAHIYIYSKKARFFFWREKGDISFGAGGKGLGDRLFEEVLLTITFFAFYMLVCEDLAGFLVS